MIFDSLLHVSHASCVIACSVDSVVCRVLPCKHKLCDICVYIFDLPSGIFRIWGPKQQSVFSTSSSFKFSPKRLASEFTPDQVNMASPMQQNEYGTQIQVPTWTRESIPGINESTIDDTSLCYNVGLTNAAQVEEGMDGQEFGDHSLIENFSKGGTEPSDDSSFDETGETTIIGAQLCKFLPKLVAVFSVLFVLLIIVLYSGSRIQQKEVDKAKDTVYLFQTEHVCGLTQNQTSTDTVSIRTFESVVKVHEPDTIVAHCGDCGQCSNPRDIGIYDDTADTLFDTTLGCATKTLLQGREKGTLCMNANVGLTPGCTDCWMDNIMCNIHKCLFICMWQGTWKGINSNGGDANNPTSLNPCTKCDELRCVPEFLQCAGANRRRAGILSDIQRDEDKEVCMSVEPVWWKDQTLYDKWLNGANL